MLAALARTFTLTSMTLVRKAVLDACDAADGMTADFRKCQRDRILNRLHAQICRPGMTADCLAASRGDMLAHVTTDPGNAAGRPIYEQWKWDGGIVSPM